MGDVPESLGCSSRREQDYFRVNIAPAQWRRYTRKISCMSGEKNKSIYPIVSRISERDRCPGAAATVCPVLGEYHVRWCLGVLESSTITKQHGDE
ncbi:hypothetical protein PILCRDRAFT_132904 [Piloderma croceum F 1598]|uniref:Uncharacterized protein n=1 Tax=Piloderma croceum (strain F 1598) TaxID=765440 RepID=A0A0C3GIU5_PILCF|nr:hypothetical protein PILCRDRAFT_132904 [Piloderma croceum F 1598]